MNLKWALLFALCPTVSWAEGPAKSIMIGGAGGLDACGTYGHVIGLNPDGHSHLNMRVGPGLTYDVMARLQLGQPLWICAQDGDWVGVVYPQDGPDQDCGLSSPMAQPQAYAGPCTAGWVHRRYVGPLAG